MKLVSFNVNGIRAREHQLRALVEEHAPDLIGIQETKVHDDQFPEDMIHDLGYYPYYHGQKGHFGVALLSRTPLEDVQRGFDHDGDACLDHQYKPDEPLVVMGDFNISPEDTDIGIGEDNRKRWLREGKCSFLPEEREWFSTLLDWGLYDSFRVCHPDEDARFSWFDYRSRGFERDPKRGLRIDGILITAPLRDRLRESWIDYEIRAMEKPSDHCPVWAEFA